MVLLIFRGREREERRCEKHMRLDWGLKPQPTYVP